MGIKNRLLRMLTIFIMPLFISGCGPNLGIFEGDDGENYYEAFGDVKGLYDGGDHSYDVEDSLANEKTINEFSWDDGDEVEEEAYLYIIIPFEKELKIQSVVLFFKTDINVMVELSCFYFPDDSSTPEKIKYLSSPDKEHEEDEEEIVYDDPAKENSIANGSITLYKEEWSSVSFGNFQQEGHLDDYLYTAVDSLLYIRIENNSGFNRDTMTSVSFTFITLLVRAVNPDD